MQLERENASMRRRLAFLEKHVRPPAVYPATQDDMFAYMSIIWSVEKPIVQQGNARTYLQVAKK